MNDRTTHVTFWLVLAQALLPPSHLEVADAFVDGLTEDLAELAGSLDLDIVDDLAQLSATANEFRAPQALLVEYARCFLPPHGLTTLNLTRYVDGSINGPCMDALENAYQAAGIEKRDSLKDLNDHAAMQMECFAWLLGQETAAVAVSPELFAQICLVGALPRFAAALRAAAPESPYAALLGIAAKAIALYSATNDMATAVKSRNDRRHDTTLGVWRHCQSCDKPFAREKEILIMTRALEQAGLPTQHLALCPDCRDASHGFFKRMIK